MHLQYSVALTVCTYSTVLAVQYSILQYFLESHKYRAVHLQYSTVHLQYSAVHLQYSAVHLQYSAGHLQYGAVHLQYFQCSTYSVHLQ